VSLWEGFPEPGEVKRLTLGPGDRLVITYPRLLSQQEADRLRQRFAAALRDVPVIILDGGADVSVVAEEEQ